MESGEILVEARGDTDARIVQRFASVDDYAARAPAVTYAAANAAIAHMATAFGGRDKVVDGSVLLVLVVAEALVGGGECFRGRVREARACYQARGTVL